MPPQRRFLLFFLRRFQCATLLFASVLIALYVITCVYYVVRISIFEKAIFFGQTDVDKDVKGVTQRQGTRAAPSGELLAAGCSTAEGCAASLGVGPHHSSGRRYTQTYKVLRPCEPMVKQRVRNPALPADVPLWDGDSEDASAKRVDSKREAVPSVQRYVLEGLRAGSHYSIRLSFLGSPSVGFDLLLYHVRRSRVEKSMQDGVDVAGGPTETVHHWAGEPQDTELLFFSTSRGRELEFSTEEAVRVDQEDMDDAAGPQEFGATRMRPTDGAAADANDRFLPVVEVRPRVLSMPVDAYRVPSMYFNIELERLNRSFLPRMAFPLMTYFVWALIFVGYAGIYTLVSSGIASGGDFKQHFD
ncbi:hypothetical protein JIQ42_06009 [Leishmania sp. Namibia]|uniref:hypothetical protein n=1 Tax=Leishmania sp. Namibia TaxID=2802991 RepID=UPI001B43E374|nr:hypothetical protein JIQ42_06009 [Leishmania sp. Namibia]